MKNDTPESNRSRTITWSSPEAGVRNIDTTSGLDYLEQIKAGTVSPPPVAHLTGYRLSRIEEGRALFELDPDEFHYNPFSTVHGGILSLLLDTAMTASVLSTLPKGTLCTTAEMKTNFVRPVSKKTGTITCEAVILHKGTSISTAEGKIRDETGRLYAHSTGTFSIFNSSRVKPKG